jgi:hypothetical protein
MLATVGLAKSPADNSTVCDRYQRADLVFTGSAETQWITMVDTRKSPVHRRSEKSKRVRFLAREWYKGKPQNTVEVWMTPSDCPLRVEANQTYLIYARLNKDNGRNESNACMGTIPVEKATDDLPFLTAAQSGQATRVIGTAGSDGLYVQAKSGIDTRYAVTNASGQFTLDGLHAGDWSFSVKGGAQKPVHLEPGSCVDVALQ